MNIILLGPPGSGKGTQAKLLCTKLNLVHLSTGDMVRSLLDENPPSPTAVEIKKVVDRGDLLPDKLIVEILQLKAAQFQLQEFLLDGFPRTVSQAHLLEGMGWEVDFVFYLKVPDESIMERLKHRRVHLSSGRVYHNLTKPPLVEGLDDLTGEKLIHREDDREEVIKHRLQVYHQQTAPLISFYQLKPEVKYFAIDALDSVCAVQNKILEHLKKI